MLVVFNYGIPHPSDISVGDYNNYRQKELVVLVGRIKIYLPVEVRTRALSYVIYVYQI